jgi:septum formation protein
MIENLCGKEIILASQSPRRRELMKLLKVNFRTEDIVGVEEDYPDSLLVEDIPLFIANKKQSVYERFWCMPNHIVISADTIVSLEGHILGKPVDKDDAVQMLTLLSGKTHQVITGVCIRSNIQTVGFTSITDVTFKMMTQSMIRYYVDNYLPLDKAGAYGIQEWIGLTSISAINGSYFNVMGMPVDRLFDELKRF